ncbi:hypothetical protein SLS56_011121 [Neofusicoccum ribis]|uniref:Uncharacterized protein n=1 Tax=Neofusicoccum ribis TaxID=45134 RepID=A0ABR3SCJ3_9PEZI
MLEEPVAAAIWKAMEEVARVSQASTTERVGIFVRMELMKTEKHQNQYRPLQPYQEEGAIADRLRAWKQKRKEAKKREVMEEEEKEKKKKKEKKEEKKNKREASPKQLPKLSGIQKACLDFCIELLNQRITQREYDSALVCALAVQGVTPTGWREPGLYTAILSAIIKVGRFMVVQKALEMAGAAAAAAAAGEEGGDGGKFSSGGSAWDFEEEEEEEEGEEVDKVEEVDREVEEDQRVDKQWQ